MNTPLNELNEEIEAIGRMRAERDALNVGIEARTKALHERLRAGESTSDMIRDHVIRKFGFVSEKFEAVYRGIIEKTVAHGGQFILVVTRREDSRGGCFGGTTRHFLTEQYEMGVLTDQPQFLMNEHGYEFTTTKHTAWELSSDNENQVQEGNITLWIKEPAVNLNQPMHLGHVSRLARYGGEAPASLEIYIGDEEVRHWFLNQYSFLFNDERTEESLLKDFWALAEKLGRPQIPPHEREMIENPTLQANPS